MKKYSIIMCFIVCVLLLSACTKQVINTDKKPIVAVSIVPQETFVKAIAKDLINVVTLIPPGSSPANYAPTPDIMEKFSKAKLYFSIGVPTENANILPKISDINKEVKIIDTAHEVSNIYPFRRFDVGTIDPHIWMSPKRVKVMIEIIANELCELDPKNKDTYQNNAKNYIKELDILDREIKSSLNNLQNKSFIVYHPSFGYFADDYGLKMLSLEEEGKDSTPKSLQEKIDIAKKENIKVIFYQSEISSKQANAFAQELGGKTEMIAPLASDYIENLKKTAKTFQSVLK